MKKILMSILIILLIVMAYFTIFKGIEIGNIKILSIEQIKYENEKLEQQITQTEILMNTNYPSKTDELNTKISSLLTAKDTYLDTASTSTEEEIKQATIKEEYTVEFLLTKFGRYSTSNGVNLKYEITSGSSSGSNNITFTVDGRYSRIITFLSDIEDDAKLGFRIRNFKLIPNGENLTATFLVTNVSVKSENLTGGGTVVDNQNNNTKQTENEEQTPKQASEEANTNQNTESAN